MGICESHVTLVYYRPQLVDESHRELIYELKKKAALTIQATYGPARMLGNQVRDTWQLRSVIPLLP